MDRRASGVLLHLTSLPSGHGIGDLGPEARRFVDLLAGAGQTYWQVLPLHPTDTAFGNSPYHSPSVFAFSSLLISLEDLVRDGLLGESDLGTPPAAPPERVDHERVTAWKTPLVERACEAFLASRRGPAFERFCAGNAAWLDDYAAFVAFKDHFGGRAWTDWPEEVRDRRPRALASLKNALCREMDMEKARQFLFARQWTRLRARCRARGVRIFGDMPIYVDHDSADVWADPGLFKLDAGKRPAAVAGVPPDYFSATGQLWGNPVYNWEALEKRSFDWWVRRMKHNLRLFDLVRIDHFRGLVGYWEVPAGDPTAATGRWVAAPARALFLRLQRAFRDLPVIAEDLGTITPDVREVMARFGFPGMKVLLFAFGGDDPDHPYLPHTYEKNCVVYTGTHDNNTARGWFEIEAGPLEIARLSRYTGRRVEAASVASELVRLAMMSPADLAVVPAQDLLGLGAEARMNKPATTGGNWEWRLRPGELEAACSRRLAELTASSGRS